MTSHQCRKCRTPLCSDEVALSKKLRGRETTEYFCLDCLAAYCNGTREKLQAIIDFYHSTGLCALFAGTGKGSE